MPRPRNTTSQRRKVVSQRTRKRVSGKAVKPASKQAGKHGQRKQKPGQQQTQTQQKQKQDGGKQVKRRRLSRETIALRKNTVRNWIKSGFAVKRSGKKVPLRELTYKQIGRLTGLSYAIVHNIFKETGIIRRRKTKPLEGLTEDFLRMSRKKKSEAIMRMNRAHLTLTQSINTLKIIQAERKQQHRSVKALVEKFNAAAGELEEAKARDGDERNITRLNERLGAIGRQVRREQNFATMLRMLRSGFVVEIEEKKELKTFRGRLQQTAQQRQ